MATVPTGKLERELRKSYLQWLAGVDRHSDDLAGYIREFQAKSTAIIAREGGRVAALGALADFPAPKLLELSPYAGKVYDQMQMAAIQAGIATGLNSRDIGRQILNAGLGKGYKRLERLARTETVSAYWKNQWDSVASLPLLVMVWGSETSKRTCDYCLSRDGLVVEDPNIRDHPNGRCTLVPTLRSQVEYKGTLRPDGTVFMDPAWSKKAAISPQVKLPTADEISSGTRAAEQQRVSLEKARFNRKGNLNVDKGWDSETYRAWTSYTEMGNKPMNALLRDPVGFANSEWNDDFFKDVYASNIEKVAALIKKNELAEDIIVARGVVAAPGFNPGAMKAGDLFADPAFLSTTTNLKEAEFFSTGRGDREGEAWIFISKAPKGTNAVAGADYQNEITFGPGQVQRVLGVDPKTRTVYTEMTP